MITIYVCATEALKSHQGIHLIDPDEWYLNNAIQDAERDGFSVIFVHAKSKGLSFKLNADILNRLFELASMDGIRVETVNPAFSDSSPQLNARISKARA